jgi:hypothetical protein
VIFQPVHREPALVEPQLPGRSPGRVHYSHLQIYNDVIAIDFCSICDIIYLLVQALEEGASMNRLVYRAAQTIVTTLAIAATVWLIIQIRQGFLTMHSWTIMMEQCAHREIWCASNSFADAEWHIETVKPYMAFFAFAHSARRSWRSPHGCSTLRVSETPNLPNSDPPAHHEPAPGRATAPRSLSPGRVHHFYRYDILHHILKS